MNQLWFAFMVAKNLFDIIAVGGITDCMMHIVPANHVHDVNAQKVIFIDRR